ncbi:MAG: acyl-CoA thioesterase [Saprospiraceae bacterium]
MKPVEKDIKALLDLERIDTNIFRGQSQDIGTKQVFGGQVLGQAIAAAQMTISDRSAHSAHAYFLRKGDFNAPIIYEVDHSRDGRSFSTRRVVAIQHGRPIFITSASFQIKEEGLEFYNPVELPDLESAFKIPMPEGNGSSKYRIAQYFDARIIDPQNSANKNQYQIWLRLREELPDHGDLHRSILAYVSDFGLLISTLMPHGINLGTLHKVKDFILASIDHAIWFHRPFKVDEWFFYECSPVSTSSSRGMARGSFYNQAGVLIASTTQEGLIRKI